MDDAKIIALFWERDEQAVQETDAAYGRKLYGLSHRILNNCEDAQDCVSDTYLGRFRPNVRRISMPSCPRSAATCPSTGWTGAWRRSGMLRWWR